MSDRKLRPARVMRRRELAPGVFLLSAERHSDFTPGQTVSISTDASLPPRPYSIASGTGDAELEILFDVVPDGLLTPRLARLGPGDTLLVSDPFGDFVDRPGKCFWIATGTGVAPFASMARSGIAAGRTLLHGSRTLAGLYFRELLEPALGSSYLPCTSGEAAPGVYRGRVTALLAERELDTGARYLLCGSAEMIVDVRDLLIGRGVPFSRVSAEVYF